MSAWAWATVSSVVSDSSPSCSAKNSPTSAMNWSCIPVSTTRSPRSVRRSCASRGSRAM
ncbi:hypothetical protein ACN28S_67020 [Cystobacter fuscus]